METGREIVEYLKVQQGHYAAMKEAVAQQAAFIEQRNIGALAAGAAEVRGLMRKIRDVEARLRPLRQSWASQGLDRPVALKREVDALIAGLRGQITEIQEIKDRNQALLKGSMEQVRKEMAGLKSQSRVARAYYQRAPVAQQARFIDRSN